MPGVKNISPWHMWGSTETLTLNNNASGSRASVEKQLSMINYGRPDTWTFFFAAVLLSVENDPGNLQCFAHFDLTLGVGRSQIIIPEFRSFTFGDGLNPLITPTRLFATTAPAPSSRAGLVITYDTIPITDIPSEAIQVGVRIILQTPGGPPPPLAFGAQIELHSYFAPRSHIRPEWYGNEARGGHYGGPGNAVPRFNGGEDQGR